MLGTVCCCQCRPHSCGRTRVHQEYCGQSRQCAAGAAMGLPYNQSGKALEALPAQCRRSGFRGDDRNGARQQPVGRQARHRLFRGHAGDRDRVQGEHPCHEIRGPRHGGRRRCVRHLRRQRLAGQVRQRAEWPRRLGSVRRIHPPLRGGGRSGRGNQIQVCRPEPGGWSDFAAGG